MWKYTTYHPHYHITSDPVLPWELWDMVSIIVNGVTEVAGQVDMVTDDVNPFIEHEYRVTQDHLDHCTTCIVYTVYNVITSVYITTSSSRWRRHV